MASASGNDLTHAGGGFAAGLPHAANSPSQIHVRITDEIYTRSAGRGRSICVPGRRVHRRPFPARHGELQRRVMRTRLERSYRFEAAHFLPKVPPQHKCARMHGHSYLVEISIDGEVDAD